MKASQKVIDRVNGFVAKVQSETITHYIKDLPNLVPAVISIVECSKNFKIVTASHDGSSRSVYCFVSKANGDIYKAATWAAPAKHVRGNIFDANYGWKTAVNLYGANYIVR